MLEGVVVIRLRPTLMGPEENACTDDKVGEGLRGAGATTGVEAAVEGRERDFFKIDFKKRGTLPHASDSFSNWFLMSWWLSLHTILLLFEFFSGPALRIPAAPTWLLMYVLNMTRS